MARRSGFVSMMNAIARDSARRQRQAETERKRQERSQIQAARNAERNKKLLDKENKQRYLEARIEETAENNTELAEKIEALQGILEHTIDIDDTISFESLRIRDNYSPMPIPQDLSTEKPAPDKRKFITAVKTPGFLENALGMKGRYQREIQAAEAQYEVARKTYEASEQERQNHLAELQKQNEAAEQSFIAKVQQRNQEVDELETLYKRGDISAVITYNSMVLERSEYPDEFPQNFRLAYAPESKEMVVEYELPDLTVIPNIVEYKYAKTKDEIEEKPRKPAEIKELYQDIVESVTIRTLHEILEADQAKLIDIITFNGFVNSVDPATGKDIRPCLVSVRTTRENFLEINLTRIDKRACLRNLGAQVSPQPQAMQPVKPIVEFNMVDKRYIEQGDILSDLESRPNLMDLNPSEFEVLVSNLFGKMGLETKLTQTSRDGGVDAVAYDTRPVLGGKVVIQAKRYKNTVGVSAVRDLYGTMLNEGASKGILVATSKYGSDAYEFSKDKPLELIDGGGLLYLLDQVGIKARIIMPEEG
jgi:restriction system protein